MVRSKGAMMFPGEREHFSCLVREEIGATWVGEHRPGPNALKRHRNNLGSLKSAQLSG